MLSQVLMACAIISAIASAIFIMSNSFYGRRRAIGVTVLAVSLIYIIGFGINANRIVEDRRTQSESIYHVLNQSEDLEQPTYLVREGDQYHYLYLGQRYAAAVTVPVDSINVFTFETNGTPEDGKPYVAIRHITHYYDHYAWFSKNYSEVVEEDRTVAIYIPEGTTLDWTS